jgi:hypothetical protein
MQDEKGNRLDPADAKITARRKDLDGGGRSEVLKLVDGARRSGRDPGRCPSFRRRATTRPTYRQLTAVRIRSPGRADGWNEVMLRGSGPRFRSRCPRARLRFMAS